MIVFAKSSMGHCPTNKQIACSPLGALSVITVINPVSNRSSLIEIVVFK